MTNANGRNGIGRKPPLSGHAHPARQLGWQLELERAADTLAVCFVAPEKAGVWYAGINGQTHQQHTSLSEWGHNGLRIGMLLHKADGTTCFGNVVNFCQHRTQRRGRWQTPQRTGTAHEALSSILRSSAQPWCSSATPPYTRSTSLAGLSIGNWLRQHPSPRHGVHGPYERPRRSHIVAEWIEDERMQPDGMHFTAKGYSAIATRSSPRGWTRTPKHKRHHI